MNVDEIRRKRLRRQQRLHSREALEHVCVALEIAAVGVLGLSDADVFAPHFLQPPHRTEPEAPLYTMSAQGHGTARYRQPNHKSAIIKLPEMPIQGALLWRG